MLQLPVNQSRITAIGYYAASDGAVGLTPIGSQANQGLLKRVAHAIFGGGSGSPRWYLLPGGDGHRELGARTSARPPEPTSTRPSNGTIVGIEKVTIDGKVYGQRIDIQPTYAPSLVVSVSDLAADPSISVGAAVTAGSSKLGELLALSRFETQSLARYTNDKGDHVLIEVHPAATLAVG